MPSETNGKPAVILLAEDDPGDQNLMVRAFSRAKFRNTFHIVSDGEEALDYLRQKGQHADPRKSPRPDLLLLDLNMPKIDGLQVLREMRGDDALRRIPVVVMTTSQQEEDVIRSYDLGVNSYVSKPKGVGEFLQVVEAIENYWFTLVVLPPR